jgi:hypothetical protein
MLVSRCPRFDWLLNWRRVCPCVRAGTPDGGGMASHQRRIERGDGARRQKPRVRSRVPNNTVDEGNVDVTRE